MVQYNRNLEEVDRHISYIYYQNLMGNEFLEESRKVQLVEWLGYQIQFNCTQINDWVIPVLRN